ncbi:MAG: hypothetical protein KF824_10950 [Fimbriimonadaceae bacterium]|nr:MAG: hypothetical protein KF824_10950 [Fimbriimonadaceae bacterium]
MNQPYPASDSDKRIRLIVAVISLIVLVVIVACAVDWYRRSKVTGVPVRINMPSNFRGTLIFEEDKNAPPVVVGEHEIVIDVPASGIVRMKDFSWRDVWREYRYFVNNIEIRYSPDSPKPNELAVYDGRDILRTNLPRRSCSYIGSKEEYERNFDKFQSECAERN